MNREQIYETMKEIFREIFDDEALEITDETSANDIEDWDSFEQINLLVAIEDNFGLEVSLKQANSMENVGQMIDYVYERLAE